jgi:DNA-binding winged helix-turn-helix (wHTH) protein
MCYFLSKEIPMKADFHFGPFKLTPVDRLLSKHGNPLALPPKAFDLLTILVKNGGNLVSRKVLLETVWADAEVEDANLTNNITALRKILGSMAIASVPKFGYRFCIPVTATPALPLPALGILRTGQLQMNQRNSESVVAARDSFWLVIAQVPQCAEAWAWLGRSSRFLEKFGVSREYHRTMASAAFQQAFILDRDLPCAHHFYTNLQVDRGEALAALHRLLRRIKLRPHDTQIFASLVQVCRFCGLLEASEAAHRRAAELQPDVSTSVPHTYFARCDYHAVIEMYAKISQGTRGYLDLAAWACLGSTEHACREALQRIATHTMPPVFEALLSSLVASLRRDGAETQRICLAQDLYEDPETALYFARHLAHAECNGSALDFLRQAIDGGLAITEMLERDPWLASLRPDREFQALLRRTRVIRERGEKCLRQAHVSQLLFTSKPRSRA